MDFEFYFHTIMTDAKGSKSNIAAKFQNALNLHFLPPIGVFWDIENCQVPRGKSAIALVQNIREKFFAHHREAEFMCVCDINKERKSVIQELILAQVTVVHISATSKNAADEKLKQCMRRFVDTHGAPSTLLLISDDVNFSSDLSDFRHRHNIRIILIHRGRAHQSLIACAHEHYDFSTIAFDLPPRIPAKSPDRRPTTLVVTDLPTHKSVGQIRTLLRKLSQNCGGKVSEVRGSKAFIKFATPDATERAQKRMDKEFLYGNKISVNFCHLIEKEFSVSPFKRTKDFNSGNEASGSSSCSRDSSDSPQSDTEDVYKIDINNLSRAKFDFPPPPILDNQTFPSLLKNHISQKEPHPQNSTKYVNSSPPSNMEVLSKENKNFQLDWNIGKMLNTTNSKKMDISAFSPFKKEPDSMTKPSQKNVGRVTPFLMLESDKNGRSTFSDPGGMRCSSSKIENTSNYLFSNHSYQNPVQKISSSFEIHRINEPYFYSSWSGAAAVSDSALSINRSNQASSIEKACVELHVSNLDPTFEVNEMKRILLSVFREHVMVLHISMSLQPDGSPKATVKVPSLQDAQFAISRLHRKKIGHKRILISHVSSNKIPPFHVLKSETIALLSDIPNKSLPLIKFRELYEKRDANFLHCAMFHSTIKRVDSKYEGTNTFVHSNQVLIKIMGTEKIQEEKYHRPIAVSELYKMREAVTIQGDSGSRTVYLNTEFCNTPSLSESEDSQECSIIERPYCEVHFKVSSSEGWAEQYNICPLPLVHISLKVLATAVHRLLDSHQGSLPLISFCDCYEADIGPLPIVANFIVNTEESFEVSFGANQALATRGPKGVPLEHLIACIAGVEVAKSVLCIKKVQWLEKRAETQAPQNFSPALMGQLTLFSREVMDLLKSQPQCLVQFNKFIPTYHHHFGRQCRVADYGFTKLIDLLEAIPHIVQVLGEGQSRQVTLTHKTQVRRFAAELLRILKSRASKQITVSEFAQAYEQVIEKPFEITNYGVCEIEDMVSEVPENMIVTSGSGNETIISIPKREQTPEEIERTKQFSDEVVELMKHTTNCSMSFNKFIPSYHHHFGKQCRVADYGFTKLIELFEVIPNILEVTGTGEDKVLVLVETEQHKILSERLVTVLKAQPNEMVDIMQLCSAYAQVHGHVLRPSDFGFTNLVELLEKFHSTVKIVNHPGRTYVCLINHELIHQVSVNLRRLLMAQKDCKISLKDVCAHYQAYFQQNIDVLSYLSDLTDVVQISNGFLQLTSLQLLARNIIVLLEENGFQLPLNSIGNFFQQKYGILLSATDYGFQSLSSLLEHFSDYFVLRGKRQKRLVCLNSEAIGYPSYNQFYHPLLSVNDKSHNLDILNQPVPSCIPTPTIEPHVPERFEDLMGFETPVQGTFYANKPLETKFAKENPAIPSIRISKPLELVPSVGESIHYQSSSTPFTCSNPPFEISTGVSSYPFMSSFIKNKEAIDFYSNADASVHSEKNRSKYSPVKSSKFEIKLDIKFENNTESSERPTCFKHSEHHISSSNINKCSMDAQSLDVTTKYKNHSLGTKDDVPTTSASEGKQSRRKRIAAQFSSPIDD